MILLFDLTVSYLKEDEVLTTVKNCFVDTVLRFWNKIMSIKTIQDDHVHNNLLHQVNQNHKVVYISRQSVQFVEWEKIKWMENTMK